MTGLYLISLSFQKVKVEIKVKKKCKTLVLGDKPGFFKKPGLFATFVLIKWIFAKH